MKKLMIAASAAAVAGAALAADLSSGVVGYQGKGLTGSKRNYVISTFKAVDKDKDKMTLKDIVPAGDWEWGFDLQIYDGEGGTAGRYYYANAADAESEGIEVGWYDADAAEDADNPQYVCCNTTIIPYGSGIMMNPGNNSSLVNFAGEVVRGSTELTLTGSKRNYTGNATPTDQTLKEFVPGGDWEWGFDLQIYDGEGGTAGRYYYANEEDASGEGIEVGWYDADAAEDPDDPQYVCCNDVAVPAGSGFMMNPGNNTSTIVIPEVIK